MSGLFALLRMFGTFNALFKGPGAVAKRQARKAGFRGVRKTIK